ncbi:hypothetical protein BU17DRAFT_90696 [Hysterangium stoloniferum]|nr:hypothetical protein BU17DRAFT_90696 [Hysterangium stoloniferum]
MSEEISGLQEQLQTALAKRSKADAAVEEIQQKTSDEGLGLQKQLKAALKEHSKKEGIIEEIRHEMKEPFIGHSLLDAFISFSGLTIPDGRSVEEQLFILSTTSKLAEDLCFWPVCLLYILNGARLSSSPKKPLLQLTRKQYNFEAVAIEYSADNSYSMGTVSSDVYQYIVKAHLRKLLLAHAARNVEIIREIDGSNVIFVKGLSGDKTVSTVEIRHYVFEFVEPRHKCQIRQRLTDISNKATDDIKSALKGMQISAVNLGVDNVNHKHDGGDVEEIESPSKRSRPSPILSKGSALISSSKSKKRHLLTAGTSSITPFSLPSSSQVTATRPFLTMLPTAATFQPVTASHSSPKGAPERDPPRGVLQADDTDDDEVVIVECEEAPGTSNFLHRPKDSETLCKASNVIREVMMKITEDEMERLRLEGALRQRIIVLEGELKSERLARQLAERLLVATPLTEDNPEVQHRMVELEKKLAEMEVEEENMRILVEAFAEQMNR